MAKKKKLKKTKKAAKKVKKTVRKAKKAKGKAKKSAKKTKKGKKKAGKAKKGRKGKKTKAAKPMKKTKPTKKPMTAQKQKAISSASAAVMQRLIGKVVHYYDRIGVAIIDLNEPLNVGDMVMLKKGDTIVPQRIESIEIEHASVASAKPGDIVGVKVDTEAYEGTVVLPG
ncbi:MAG: hypothetical protein Greene041662_607 [Candidatus Peregrinibacteria bacterium Greene0416_62]|nr:MAG: hypothetical protein Greene041662_607 [Candidatus Peregrinibacteria bacterium Greene0416_62]TSC98083.1 MAG: hypothetical protein Greene101449_1010 [Candidatus Peregrinibacteria bacterium Greene1014_49]